MTKHTSGPWVIMPEARAASRWVIGDAEGGSIGECAPPGPWMPEAEADANARLIAAAPELLAALVEWHAFIERGGLPMTEGVRHCWSLTRAAIAKAENG